MLKSMDKVPSCVDVVAVQCLLITEYYYFSECKLRVSCSTGDQESCLSVVFRCCHARHPTLALKALRLLHSRPSVFTLKAMCLSVGATAGLLQPASGHHNSARKIIRNTNIAHVQSANYKGINIIYESQPLVLTAIISTVTLNISANIFLSKFR